MLDMGFIHDVRKIIKLLPPKRQSLLFSATMPKDIVEISKSLLGNNFERVTIKPDQATAERVEQAVYMVTKKNKGELLQSILKDIVSVEQVEQLLAVSLYLFVVVKSVLS